MGFRGSRISNNTPCQYFSFPRLIFFSTAAAMGTDFHEYLAASTLRPSATAPVGKSFTRRFIDLLQATDKTEVTVAQIHAKLAKEANQYDSKLFYTPIHIASAEKPTITLRPLYRGPREVYSSGKNMRAGGRKSTNLNPSRGEDVDTRP